MSTIINHERIVWTSGFKNGPELIISYRFKFLKSLMKIGKIWLISIILWWIEIGMKNPNPPSSALFPFLRLYLKRQKSNYLYLFLRVWWHGGMEPPGGWGNSASCVRKMARVFSSILKVEPERSKAPRSGKAHVFISCAHIVIIHFLFCCWSSHSEAISAA